MVDEGLPRPVPASTSLAYAFDDPGERRIYERLSRIGPGPAAFWRDACFLTHNPGVLVSSVHMIGHALRELESAVRHVLRVTLRTDGSGHRSEIEEILEALGIPLDEAAARAWLGIPGENGFHAWAHRKQLGIRAHDEEFRILWSNVVAFLDSALEAFDAASIRALDALDSLLSVQPPGDREISSFTEDLPQSVVVLDHFAENAPPTWLEPLWRSGHLGNVPEARDLAEGETGDQLRWPLSRYLLRMAQTAEYREVAVKAALEITDRLNPYVHLDLAEIALLADPDDAAQFVPFARPWLDLNPSFLLVDRLTKLAEKLLESGQDEAGFNLAQLLTELDQVTDE